MTAPPCFIIKNFHFLNQNTGNTLCGRVYFVTMCTDVARLTVIKKEAARFCKKVWHPGLKTCTQLKFHIFDNKADPILQIEHVVLSPRDDYHSDDIHPYANTVYTMAIKSIALIILKTQYDMQVSGEPMENYCRGYLHKNS